MLQLSQQYNNGKQKEWSLDIFIFKVQRCVPRAHLQNRIHIKEIQDLIALKTLSVYLAEWKTRRKHWPFKVIRPVFN